LPDFKITKVNHLVACKSKPMVDLNPANVYAAPKAEEESKDVVYVEPKQHEYIFLIDRSGSMAGRKILLARQALMLFL
jgi:Mg-chelatase subunit ChlD